MGKCALEKRCAPFIFNVKHQEDINVWKKESIALGIKSVLLVEIVKIILFV